MILLMVLIKRNQLCFYFLLLGYLGNAQVGRKIDGIYFGKLVHSENALVISTKDTIAVGFVYLNQFERFELFGIYSGGSLKGGFIVNGEELLIVGKLVDDSLKINLLSTSKPSEINQTVLLRVASNPKKDISSVFGNEKPEHDEKLIGIWVALKSVNSEGKNILKSNHQQEFKSNGFISLTGQAIDKILDSDRSKKIILPRYSWQTKAGRIVFKRQGNMGGVAFPGPDEDVYPYEIRGDTLIITNPKAKNYYIKKRNN